MFDYQEQSSKKKKKKKTKKGKGFFLYEVKTVKQWY